MYNSDEERRGPNVPICRLARTPLQNADRPAEHNLKQTEVFVYVVGRLLPQNQFAFGFISRQKLFRTSV